MGDTGTCFELLGKGDVEGLRGLFERDPATAGAKDAAGVSLLMHALYRGRRDLAELIASKKKEIDIFEAASLGNLERLEVCARHAAAISHLCANC